MEIEYKYSSEIKYVIVFIILAYSFSLALSFLNLGDVSVIFTLFIFLFFFIFCFIDQKKSLLILVLWTYFQHSISLRFNNFFKNLDLVDEVILLGLLIYVSLVICERKKIKSDNLYIFFSIFFLFILFSTFYNNSNILKTLLSFRDIFQYALLYFIIFNLDIKLEFLKKLFSIIYFIAVLQFVFVSVQLFLWYNKYNNILITDSAVGSFGQYGSYKLAYFISIIIIVSLGKYLYSKDKKHIFFILLFLIILILANARAAFFILPVSIFLGFFDVIKNQKKSLIIILSILVIFVIFLFFYNYIITNSSATTNLKVLINQQRGLEPTTARRIGFMEYSFNMLNNFTENKYIGSGPGTYISKTGLIFKDTELYQRYRSDFPEYNWFPGGTQVSPTIVEYGYIGFPMIIFIYLYLIYKNNSLYKRIKRISRNRAYMYNRCTFNSIIIFYLVSMFGTVIFEIQTVSLFVWFFIIVTFRSYKDVLAVGENENIFRS